MINEKKLKKKKKKKSYLMFNSQKNIFKNDKIAFILNKKTFLNRFENVKNKLNKDLSNLSQKNLLSITQRSSSTKTINDYKISNNRNIYSSTFRDSFLKNTNESKGNELKISNCSKSIFYNKFDNEFNSFKLNNYFCYINKDYDIKGIYNIQIFNFFEFRLEYL